MKKILCLFLAFILSTSFLLASAESDFIEKNGGEICSFALYENGEKILSFGDDEFLPIGSVSKTFTAALILKLCREGKISLDDTYITYVPELNMADERQKDITIGMLLNHTAGLFGSSYKNSMLYKDAKELNHSEFLSLMCEQRLRSNPGEMASYSNDGYTLLEILIEKVTKKSYTTYLHEEFDGILNVDEIKTAIEFSEPKEDSVCALASGGIYTDADTLCLFAHKLFNEGYLNDDSLDAMMSLREGALPLESFGYGWDDVSAYPFSQYGIKAVAKGGDTFLYHSALLVLPEKNLTAAVIIKGGSSVLAQAKASDMIMGYLNEKEDAELAFYDFDKTQKEAVNIKELEKYVGFYISNAAQYYFSLDGEVGVLTNLYTQKKSRLKYMGDGRFDAVDGVIYFAEINGETYILSEEIVSLGEREKHYFGEYIALKRKSYPSGEEMWKQRNGKVYFVLDESYTSQLYMQGIPTTSVYFTPEIPNYLGYMKIVSPERAFADLPMPGAYGRDITDFRIINSDGTEYAKAQGWTFIDSSSIKTMYEGEKSICTILPDGYARWFKVGNAFSKNIEANISGKGMFAIYNQSGICTYSSLSKEGESVLPENGYIVFAGDAGTVFEITLK